MHTSQAVSNAPVYAPPVPDREPAMEGPATPPIQHYSPREHGALQEFAKRDGYKAFAEAIKKQLRQLYDFAASADEIGMAPPLDPKTMAFFNRLLESIDVPPWHWSCERLLYKPGRRALGDLCGIVGNIRLQTAQSPDDYAKKVECARKAIVKLLADLHDAPSRANLQLLRASYDLGKRLAEIDQQRQGDADPETQGLSASPRARLSFDAPCQPPVDADFGRTLFPALHPTGVLEYLRLTKDDLRTGYTPAERIEILGNMIRHLLDNDLLRMPVELAKNPAVLALMQEKMSDSPFASYMEMNYYPLKDVDLRFIGEFRPRGRGLFPNQVEFIPCPREQRLPTRNTPHWLSR